MGAYILLYKQWASIQEEAVTNISCGLIISVAKNCAELGVSERWWNCMYGGIFQNSVVSRFLGDT